MDVIIPPGISSCLTKLFCLYSVLMTKPRKFLHFVNQERNPIWVKRTKEDEQTIGFFFFFKKTERLRFCKEVVNDFWICAKLYDTPNKDNTKHLDTNKGMHN